MADPGRWEPRRRARRRALQALYQWQISGHEADAIIDQFIETQDFQNVDAELFRSLVKGVANGHEALASALQVHLDRPLADCDVMERVILLLGAWQLLNEPATPFQVVLDESIDLAKRFGSGQSPVFVNGVLDQACRTWVNSTSSG